MFNMILEALFGFIVIQGICSKSMQNVTIDDSKFVTTDMLENWKKNMTDWITDALDRKFSACDYVVTVLKVTIRTKSLYAYTVKPVLRGHLWDKEKVAL